MLDPILGEIIGGVIASIAPLDVRYFDPLHWKRKAKLNHQKGMINC